MFLFPCGALGFTMALKAFIKPLSHQKEVKKKITSGVEFI